jgi:5,10-methylene-tetrahydrofolate dehydrogenase/methenyl tetrahydrofolate cyclohydrolase
MGFIMVSPKPESKLYERMKAKACEEVGIDYKGVCIDEKEKAEESEIIALIDKMADDPVISGIIVQLPLPAHFDSEKVLSHIPAHKDVDGLDPYNIGALGMKGRNPYFVSCTPLACLELIVKALEEKYGTKVKGSCWEGA